MSGSKRRTRYKSVDPVTLANRVKAGEVRAVSRLITLLESQEPVGQAALERLNGSQRYAAVIGITGYPGSGKSTLIDQLVTAYRRQGQKVGVVAMDTTSPRTGGAHTVVAVVAPGLGDEVQAMKAGLLETAHIVVVNKGDRDGADTTVKDLQEWHHKVVRTVAIKGEGIPELIEAIAAHQRMTDLRGERGT